jgi:hypothetical protein
MKSAKQSHDQPLLGVGGKPANDGDRDFAARGRTIYRFVT